MIKNDNNEASGEKKMDDSTKAMIRLTMTKCNNDAEKTAKWFAQLIRCSIKEVRPLIAEAIS